MAPWLSKISSLLAVASAISSVAADCSSNTTQVVPWANLTTTEKNDYINASLCLTTESAKLGLGGAPTRWDEIDYNHIYQVSWIHFVGQFLPWHRYFVSVHRSLMRDECGYTGRLPYWDELADAELSDLSTSPMFTASAFGGNGTGSDECITNGPFVNVTLYFNTGDDQFGDTEATADNHCIFRDLDSTVLSDKTVVDECLAYDDFVDMWDCVEQNPHGAGHTAVGGLMANAAYSPGDPMFFLHHAYIDLLWWRWQSANLTSRLTAIGGTNQPTEATCEARGQQCPGASILDYDGDPGNTTTLNHTLWMMDIYPNVTVADVMDISYNDVCLEYFWDE